MRQPRASARSVKRLRFAPAILRTRTRWKRYFKRVDAVYGRVDILLNGPFAFNREKPEKLTLADWNDAIAVCLTGFFTLRPGRLDGG